MDVLAKLDEELRLRKDYTLEQKKRYLYLRTCQMFSYDSRYHYCTYPFLGKKAEKIKKEILENRINLKEVSNFNVVCKNYSEDVYSVLLKELLDTDSEIARGGHSYIEFQEGNQTIKADATLGDLTRAKMKLQTHGYKPVSRDREYAIKLKNVDKMIHYIEKDYDDLFWIGLMGMGYYQSLLETGLYDFCSWSEEELALLMNDTLLQEVEMNRKSRQFLLSKDITMELSDEIVITKLEKIKRALENYKAKANENRYHLEKFEDANILVMDFMQKLSLYEISQVSLFQDQDDKDWEFINIYPVHLKNGDTIYYALEKEEKEYGLHPISEPEAISYTKELKGMNKEYIYRR